MMQVLKALAMPIGLMGYAAAALYKIGATDRILVNE